MSHLLIKDDEIAESLATTGGKWSTLVVDKNLVLTTDLTIPANTLVEFKPGTKIVSNGYSLTFDGVGISGTPSWQIFSGFAFDKLTWNNATPEMRLEWFGGGTDVDNASALTLVCKLLSRSKSNGRRGGVIRFFGGVYNSSHVNLDEQAYNIRFEGNGTKAVSFGSDADTILMLSNGISLRSAQGLHFNNLGICYNNNFAGTLIDCSRTVSGAKALRFTNCVLGSAFPPNGTPKTTAACILDLSSAYDCQASKCVIIGGQVGVRLNPSAPQDGNIITISECEVSHCLTAGIMNPHQQANIINNNFEGTNMVSAPSGGLPYAISYDYADPENGVVYGLNIAGNWFGDRTTNGKAYIRLPRTKGANISGNFFAGGYNTNTEFNSAAIEVYHGSTLNVSGNFFGGGAHCVKFTLPNGGNTVAFHGNSTQYAEQSVVNPNNGALGQKFFNEHGEDDLSILGSN